MKGICGINCDDCAFKDNCGGCAATNGKPFGGDCVLAVCCGNKGQKSCVCSECAVKTRLLEEINALHIEGMPPVTALNALAGFFVNMEYDLCGSKVKLLEDNKIYLGSQLPKADSGRCYGIAADEKYLLICEYGENGADPEIVLFKKR